MEQKHNGKHLNKTKEVCKLIILFIMLSLTSCKGQERKQSIVGSTYYNIVDFSEKSNEINGILLFQSNKLADFFGLKSNYFIDKGGQLLYNNLSISELVSIENSSDIVLNKENDRFIFMVSTKNNKTHTIQDTLKISKGYDYSICQLDEKGESLGIAVGKYKIQNNDHYFEVHHIYSISDNKFQKESLNTLIYDCPPPNDYVSDEEPDTYLFGVRNGKKYVRFWFEN